MKGPRSQQAPIISLLSVNMINNNNSTAKNHYKCPPYEMHTIKFSIISRHCFSFLRIFSQFSNLIRASTVWKLFTTYYKSDWTQRTRECNKRLPHTTTNTTSSIYCSHSNNVKINTESVYKFEKTDDVSLHVLSAEKLFFFFFCWQFFK